MGSEWPRVVVSDVCELIVDCVNKTAPVVEGPTPFKMVRTPNVKNGVVSTDSCRFVESDTFEKWTRRADVRVGDVLLTREAPLGEVGIVTSEEKLFLGQRLMQYRANPLVLDAKFLLYSFLSNDLQHQFSMHEGSGSVVSHIRVGDCLKFELNLPPLDEQKRISHALGCIDQKIQLNRQTNQTLEQMAQALFKSWFVDFDPVIDNALAAGKPIPEELQARAQRRQQQLAKPDHQPLPDDVRQLFPSEFEKTEALGWVPKGWEVSELRNCIDVLETGRRPKGGIAKYKSGVPSVGAESIKGIGNFEFGKTKYVPDEFFEKMKSGKVQDYDVLLYKDGGKPGDFKPRIGMFGEGFPFKKFGINEHVFRLRSALLGQFFLYYQLGSERIFHQLSVRGGKAAIPGINQEEVKSQLFLVPSKELLEAFNDQASTFVELALKNSSSSLTLEHLRDTLLPKLISGELRLPESMLDSETNPLMDEVR